MRKSELLHLAVGGTEIAVRVTPGAASNTVKLGDGQMQIRVTAIPEFGKATKAAQKLLAHALGIAPSRLNLIRGQTSRSKVFRID